MAMAITKSAAALAFQFAPLLPAALIAAELAGRVGKAALNYFKFTAPAVKFFDDHTGKDSLVGKVRCFNDMSNKQLAAWAVVACVGGIFGTVLASRLLGRVAPAFFNSAYNVIAPCCRLATV